MNPNLEQSLMTTRLIWGALFFSLFTFTLVAQLMVGNTTEVSTSPNQVAIYLHFAGVAVFIVGLLIPRFLGPPAKKMSTDFDSEKRTTPTPAELQKYFTCLVVTLAVFEAVTILGLQASMIAKNFSEILPHIAASVIGFLLNIPTKEKMQAYIQ